MGVQLSPLRDQGSIKIHLQRIQFPTCSIRDKRRCIRNPNIEKVKSQGAKMASEKFCLRWNDVESNISVAFRELREEKDFLMSLSPVMIPKFKHTKSSSLLVPLSSGTSFEGTPTSTSCSTSRGSSTRSCSLSSTSCTRGR